MAGQPVSEEQAYFDRIGPQGSGPFKLDNGQLYGVFDIPALVNGGMNVAQRENRDLTDATKPLAYGDAVYGAVDRVLVYFDGSDVTNGTFTQDALASIGTTGHAAHLSNLSLSGSGVAHFLRLERGQNMARFIGKTVSMGIILEHNIGSAKTVTLKIYETDTLNTFSSGNITLISSSGGESVSDSTETWVKFEGVDLSSADPGKGLVLEAEVDTGGISDKNIRITEWKLEEGPQCTPFVHEDEAVTRDRCTRYSLMLRAEAWSATSICLGMVTGSNSRALFNHPEMVQFVHSIEYSNVGHFGLSDKGAGKTVTGLSLSNAGPSPVCTRFDVTASGATFDAGDATHFDFLDTSGWLLLDAEYYT